MRTGSTVRGLAGLMAVVLLVPALAHAVLHEAPPVLTGSPAVAAAAIVPMRSAFDSMPKPGNDSICV